MKFYVRFNLLCGGLVEKRLWDSLPQTPRGALEKLELGNVSCRVGFVFGLNLNGLKNPKSEPDLYFTRTRIHPTRI